MRMAKRKESATWKGPTHAIVHFGVENSKAVVPLKKIKLNDSEVPNVGNRYTVKWTDKKTYLATVEALGSASEMQET